MSLVEEYYELNEVEKVSTIWKALHIGIYGIAGALGLWCGFTIAYLRLKFDDRCYLFTRVKISSNNSEIDHSNINWESDTWCDYYQFSMISSLVVGIIWGTLFLMCGKGGKSVTGLPQPWRIVWPSLIFNLIYFIVILSSAIQIQLGTDYFCASERGKITAGINHESKSLLSECKIVTVLLKKDFGLIAFHLETVLKTAWGCALSWLLVFLLSLTRIICAVDFQLYKIGVFKVDDSFQNKREKILRITNYEEPKQLLENDDEKKINEIEDISQELDTWKKRKNKSDKKLIRHFNIVNRSLMHPKTIFYETADIRMLQRSKTKNSLKTVDETFPKNENYWANGLGKSPKIQSNSTVSGNLEIPTNYFSKQFDKDGEEDEENGRSIFTSQTSNVDEDWGETGSGSEALVPELDENHLLKFKKQI